MRSTTSIVLMKPVRTSGQRCARRRATCRFRSRKACARRPQRRRSAQFSAPSLWRPIPAGSRGGSKRRARWGGIPEACGRGTQGLETRRRHPEEVSLYAIQVLRVASQRIRIGTCVSNVCALRVDECVFIDLPWRKTPAPKNSCEPAKARSTSSSSTRSPRRKKPRSPKTEPLSKRSESTEAATALGRHGAMTQSLPTHSPSTG